MKNKIAIALSLALLTGCATTTLDPNYQAYIEAQKVQMSKDKMPIMRIKAFPGQSITLSGVEEFSVYSQEGTNQQTAAQQYQPPRNDAVEIAKSFLGVAGVIGGTMAGGWAAKGIVNATGAAANHGYQFIQAPAVPQANMTIGGSGVIGAGTASTIGGSGSTGSGAYTTQALAGGSVLGGGSTIGGNGSTGAGGYDSSTKPVTTTTTPTTTTTTSTNTDSHNTTN